MHRNEMIRHLRTMVIEGQISCDDVAEMASADLALMFGKESISEKDVVCLKRHAQSAGRVRDRMQPARDISGQLEGGNRTWFRNAFPEAVLSMRGDVLTVNLSGEYEEEE